MPSSFDDPLFDNPQFIDSIFNYCDRWCERCPMTRRCRLFAMEALDEAEEKMTSLDEENQNFIKRLEKTLGRTLEMLQKAMEERAVLVDDAEFNAQRTREKHWQEPDHPLMELAGTYATRVAAWFDSVGEVFVEKSEELTGLLRVGLEAEAREGGEAIREGIEIIRWYQFLIGAKVGRAISGSETEELFSSEENENTLPSDSDGSAKVALIAIDRSIAAWGILLEAFPEQGDNILELLVLLQQLSQGVEKTFPRGRSFVRPGFDSDS